MTGLVVSSTGSNAQRGAAAAWTITAPLGTSLRRIDVQRAFQKWDKDWSVEVRTAEGAVLDTCAIGGAQVSCAKGLDPGTQAAAYTDLGTRSVSFGLTCLAAHEWPASRTRSRRGSPSIAPSSTSTIRRPRLSSRSAERSSRQVGTVVPRKVDIAASDVSGIKRLRLLAGETTLYDRLQGCDMSRMQPCPASKRETVTVDTSGLPDGTHELKAVATDAADQPGIATAVLKIDRHAPEKPTDLAVDRNPDGTLALMWTNPDQGTAAPIVGARYEVCDAAGGNCVAGESVGGA